MNERDESVVAMSGPMGTGGAANAAVGIHAPIGAVSAKDRERAARTALTRDGDAVVLHTELTGAASLQRLDADGTWDTLEKRPTSKVADTRFELPDAAATYRVVFSPKNSDIPAWVSAELGA